MSNDPKIDKVLSRIRKCLALSASSNPHEAAAALRQARKLMEQHGISDEQVQLSDVKEKSASAGRDAGKPPAWLSRLALVVSEAFGVARYYNVPIVGPCAYVFVGVGPAAEVASYAFTVLRRKCTSARDQHYRQLRGKRYSRIRRADAYAMGWVIAVEAKVREFAQAVPKIVGQYLKVCQPGLVTIKPVNRTSEKDRLHMGAGYIDGQAVDLHHGVRGHKPLQLGSG